MATFDPVAEQGETHPQGEGSTMQCDYGEGCWSSESIPHGEGDAREERARANLEEARVS